MNLLVALAMIESKTGITYPDKNEIFLNGYLLYYKGEIIGNWETQEIY